MDDDYYRAFTIFLKQNKKMSENKMRLTRTFLL